MLLYGQRQSYELGSTNESLFVHVARINGPLPDYHPQMLLQCLLWGAILSLTLCVVFLTIVQERYH